MKNKNRTGLEVAVIGMAGRFPGADNVEQFWENIKNGVNSTYTFSDEELKQAGVPEEIYSHPDYIRVRGRLERGEFFDADFFEYTDNEARIMDPQVRLLTECSYEALEDAGYNTRTYKGTVGFYAGSLSNHFWEKYALSQGISFDEQFEALHLVDKDFLNSRIAYKLNLKGPSITVAAACATSLTAVHLAVRALLTGECQMALAGGSTLLFPAGEGYMYKEGYILSRDGICRTFDEKANGTVAGEGAGVVVLKLLDKAIADNDYIHAVIKGSAVNSDGAAKAGYISPSVDGPARAVKTALRFSKVEPDSIDYIETHGTGTLLGDHIEFEALKEGLGTDKKGFCYLGSHKPNIGYLGPASGVTSLIKTIQALKHKKIPPVINYNKPNPQIDLENSPFRLTRELVDWESKDGRPRRASINNIAVGGNNVHLILEEAPEQEQKELAGVKLLLLSAKTQTALELLTKKYIAFFRKKSALSLTQMAYTLQTGRRHLNHRRVVLFRDRDDVVDNLLTLDSKFSTTREAVLSKQQYYFLFPGSDAIYNGLCRELYETIPLFREAVDLNLKQASSVLDEGFEFSFTECKKEDEELQAFILYYSMAQVLLKLDIKPSGIMGYGIGEYVGAVLSGVFSFEESIKIIAYRKKLFGGKSEGIGLRAVMSREEALSLLKGSLSIQAVLPDSKIIFAGLPEDINSLAEELKTMNRESFLIRRELFAHSELAREAGRELSDFIKGISLNPPQIPLFSSVTGNWLTNREAQSPEYWGEQLCRPMDMAAGIGGILQSPNATYIEIGPSRFFTTLISSHDQKTTAHSLFNLMRASRESVEDELFFLDKLGKMWSNGTEINWNALYLDEKIGRISLPTYPFQQKDYRLNIVIKGREQE